MIDFIKHDFSISKIDLACFLKPGEGVAVHKNRPSHGLALHLGAERTFFFDKKKINISNNSIIYFPKGSNYVIKDKVTSECYAINFQMPDNAGFEPFAFSAKNVTVFLESFKKAHKIWEKKSPGYNTKVKSEIYNIIYNMQTEYNIPYSNSGIIQPAVDYIHSNYFRENISIEYLASLCNISTVHLRNTFIKAFALSPVKYINNLKFTRAKELLSSGLYNVSEVCFLSGFNNESYFCREFKKQFNIPPSKYANK